MNKYLILTSFIVLFFVINTFAADFTQTYDLEIPIRIKSVELHEISNDIYNYLEQSNKKEENKISGHLEFSSEKYDAKFDLPMEESEIRKIPDNSTGFSLYISSNDPNISSVQLVLSDRNCYIRVSGENFDQVVGLLNVVKEKINPYVSGFGGSTHRTILTLTYWLVLFGILVLFNFGNDFQPKIWGISLLAMILLQNVPLYAINWKSIFPGVLITHNNLSFLQEYSHIFTFFSFLIALIPVGVIRKKIFIKKC